ncbi:MAG TPA: DUF1829 domain-containing protein [bacterium]|nr:DUF1829 domain-containing protein [bacterium]
MIKEIETLIEKYFSWLKDKTTFRQIDDWVEITTPYLDRHNDYLQIYAKKENYGYILSDDGYTLTDLEHSGCSINSTKRKQLFLMTLNGFGVKQNGNSLFINASSDNFALRKHNLIQSILAINDMFYLSEPFIKSLFFEDVANWFDSNDIRYSPKVSFVGKTGYNHNFDFIIPKSHQTPERIIRSINRPNKDTATTLVMAWFDTKDSRPEGAKAFAMLNDRDKTVSSDVITALKNYDVKPVLWSNKNDFLNEFAA